MNNEAIQILRTDNNGLTASPNKKDLSLKEGQPLYNSQKNYLTIGKIGGGQADDPPITVRKLEGWFSDNNGITASKLDTDYYGIYPSNEGRHLYIKNSVNHIYIEANQNIQIDPNSYLNLGTTDTSYVKGCSNSEIRFDVSNGSTTYSYLKLTNSQEAELYAPTKITIDTADLDIGSTSRNSDVDITGTLGVTGATVLGSTLEVASTTQLKNTLTVSEHTDLDSSVTIDGVTQINNTTTTNNLVVNNGAAEGGIDLKLTYASSDVDRPIWMSAAFGTPAAVANGHPAYSVATDFNYNPSSKKLTVNNATIQNGLTVTTGGATVTAGGVTVIDGGVNVTAGGVTVNAGGVTVNNGGIIAVTAGGATLNKKLTVQSEGADITGAVKVTNGTITLTNGTTNIVLTQNSSDDSKLDLTGKLSISSDITSVGNITATSTITANEFVANSDKRLKKNITPYINKKSILDLPIYEFDYINSNNHTIGCLAQDLQEICPEIVKENNEGYLSINESKLIYLLLEEVKRLNYIITKHGVN